MAFVPDGDPTGGAAAFCAVPPPAVPALAAPVAATVAPVATGPTGTVLDPRLALLRDALYSAELGPATAGSGYRIECLDATTPVTWRFTLEDVERRTTLDGHTLITAFEERHAVEAPRDRRLTAGSAVAETISLPPTADWRPAADGDAIVAFLDARRAGAAVNGCAGTLTGRCSTQLDIGWRVRGGERDVLVVEQAVWVNGVAATLAVWRLEG